MLSFDRYELEFRSWGHVRRNGLFGRYVSHLPISVYWFGPFKLWVYRRSRIHRNRWKAGDGGYYRA